jgi:hypothetical protein
MTNTEGFYPIKNLVSADGRGRITLGAEIKTKQFRVFKNNLGQILLDPLVSIPEREIWLWQNQSALQSLQKGLQEASQGEIYEMESFADFADLNDDSEE